MSVKQLDADTVEITKRVDKKISALNNFFGRDQKGFFERVTINRKTQQVDSDRLDINWWYDKPFIGSRKTFYIENREDNNSHNGELTLVVHNFWVHTLMAPAYRLHNNVMAWSFGS